MTEFSIVIPVRNGERTLRACLAALTRQTVESSRYEAIVVDDGSSDRTTEIACQSPFRLVQLSGEGAAAARNRGLEEASGEIVLFLDADCIPNPDWIERMVEPLVGEVGRPREDAGGMPAGSRRYSGELPAGGRQGTTGSEMPAGSRRYSGEATAGGGQYDGTVGRFVSSQANWVARLVQIELDRRYRRMERLPDTDFVNTATCAFRGEALPERPFDESFGKLEDLDLSFRLATEGVRMRYVPQAVVEHRHPESLRHYLRRRFLYGRFAPSLYRRHSGKAISDASTPLTRRLQLVALGLAPAGFLLGWQVGGALLALSLAFSSTTLIEAFRHSLLLGLKAPAFVLLGNLAFLAGFVLGLPTLRANGAQPESVPKRREVKGTKNSELA